MWLTFAFALNLSLVLALFLFLGFSAVRILIPVAGVDNGGIQYRVHGGSNRFLIAIGIVIAGCSSIRPGFDDGGIQNRVQRGRNVPIFVDLGNSIILGVGGVFSNGVIVEGGAASGHRSRIRSLERRLEQPLEGQSGNIVCGSR